MRPSRPRGPLPIRCPGRRPAIGACIAAAVLFSGAAPVPSAPHKGVEEVVGVSLVEVPATVLDGSGRPVRGLTKDDFDVFDDGRKVAIESLDESDFPDAKSAPAASDPKTRPRLPRTFLLLYDLDYSSDAELDRARDAGRRFVREQMGPADVAGVATIAPNGNVSLLANLTRSHDRIASALDAVQPALDHGRALGGAIPNEAAEGKGKFTAEEIDRLMQPGRAEQAAWVSRLLDALKVVAESFRTVDGRKQVILFSHGFNAMLDDNRLVREVTSVVQVFRLEDCVLHAVNVAGLSASRANSEALFTLAHDTGGQLMENSNDLSGQISRIVEATSVVYVLTFKVKLTGQPGRFHTLEVRSHRTGTKVFARAGYLEPKPA